MKILVTMESTKTTRNMAKVLKPIKMAHTMENGKMMKKMAGVLIPGSMAHHMQAIGKMTERILEVLTPVIKVLKRLNLRNLQPQAFGTK